MYFKMAFKNVKKSFKDYAIYFLTLVLAVCIFYSFNSIGEQKAVLEMNSMDATYADAVKKIISYISVFVSVVLGGLIVYANNFLIKKRNKELGIYMILGMGKGKISRILMLETLIVGVLSLISGLVLGLLISQGVSIFVSNMFEVAMSDYSFSISFYSIGKTVLYFGIMFLFVMILNTVVISKYKIIDLLTMGRKNEEIKFKNPIIYFISFMLCIVCLGIAYKLILEVGFSFGDNKFRASIILGIIGTVLFFFSLSGAVLFIVKRSKNLYFKKLNIFVVKQLNNKINTNFISMSVICLMLLVTIGVLSTGVSYKNSEESTIKNTTDYDASADVYFYDGYDANNMEEDLDNTKFKVDSGEKCAFIRKYNNNILVGDVFKLGKSNDELVSSISMSKLDFIKLSDYNKNLELLDKKPIELKDDEIFVTSSNDIMIKALNEYLKDNNSVKLDGGNYKFKYEKVILDNLKTNDFAYNMISVVINDEYLKNLQPYESIINIMYDKNNIEKSEEKYKAILEEYKNGEVEDDIFRFVLGKTKINAIAGSKGDSIVILFIGIYLGVIFLISSMAILSIQQLSEANDSIERYKSLRRLGVNIKDINKTIFTQTLIYFSIPVLLALVHSYVAIEVIEKFILSYNSTAIQNSSLMTVGFLLIMYLMYFYATYFGYKNIVKSKIK